MSCPHHHIVPQLISCTVSILDVGGGRGARSRRWLASREKDMRRAFPEQATVAEGDNLPTVLAIGVIAYVGETVGHELLGHGAVCMFDGGSITALAPLWMRCSVNTIPMVVAGPAFNFIVGGLCATILELRSRSDTLGYFFWLSCAFNVLIACGYLIVGGATTFGDWGVLFASVHPQWTWRLALVTIGLAGYFLALRMLASLYQRLAGPSGFENGALRHRTLWPAASAALAACAAEIVGGHFAVSSLGLALGSTLFVGWTLSRTVDFRQLSARPSSAALVISFQPAWLAAGILIAGCFVGVVGPVASRVRSGS